VEQIEIADDARIDPTSSRLIIGPLIASSLR
jgi:hypothetical protein